MRLTTWVLKLHKYLFLQLISTELFIVNWKIKQYMCKNYCTFYWYNNLFFYSLVIYEDRQMVIFKDLHVKTFTYCNLHFSFSNNEEFFWFYLFNITILSTFQSNFSLFNIYSINICIMLETYLLFLYDFETKFNLCMLYFNSE